jgi:mannosyltransferase
MGATRAIERPSSRRGAEGRLAPIGIPSEHLILGALTLAAAVVRFVTMGRQAFWSDETVTVQLLHLSPTGMLSAIAHTESTPPLYYCIAWVWARVFGFGEVGLRSLSALAGVAAVPVVYGAAAQLVSRRAGLFAAALVASNPFLIWYSQEARSYELVVLLAAGSLCAFAFARERPSPRALAAWAVASVLAVATHYYAGLLVIPEALWLLSAHARRRPVQLATAAVFAGCLALVPLAIEQTGHAPWIAQIPLGERVAQIPRQFLIGTGAPMPWLLLAVASAGVAVSVTLLASRRTAGCRGDVSVAAVLAAAGVALNAVLLAAGVDNLITRNVIVMWLPLAIVVAAGLGAPHASAIGAVGVGLMCATGIAATIGVALDSNLQRPDWPAVVRGLGPAPPPGAPAGRAVVIQRNLVKLWEYMPGLTFIGPAGATVDQIDVVAVSSPPRSPRPNVCWWGAACQLIPSPLPSSLPLPGFRAAGPVRHVRQFSVLRLASSRPVLLTPAMLARALSTVPLSEDLLFVQRSPGA